MNKPLPGTEHNLRIVQRNASHTITIMEAGEAVAAVLETPADGLKDKSLISIFPRRISDLMVENIEFESDAPDVSEVLRKISRVTVRTAEGKEIPVVLKINPDGIDGADTIYTVSIRPESSELSRQDKRILARRLFEKRDYVASDKITGLPDKITFVQDIEMAHHIVRGDGADATAGVIVNDGGDMKKLAEICRHIFRNDDIIARYGDNALAFLLADTHKNNAPIAFQRLRLALQSENMNNVMIGYDGLNPMEKSDKFIARLDDAVKNLKHVTGKQSVVLLSS